MTIPLLRRKSFLNILLVSFIFTLNSCVYLVVGGVGAVGGYVISPDTVEGILTGYDQPEVWDAAVEIVSVLGLIMERSDSGGVMVAKIHGARVTVTVLRMSKTAVKLTVKARKAFFPRVAVAQEVYLKIQKYLGSNEIIEE